MMSMPASQALPSVAGIGLRAPHYQEVLELRPALGWVEVHSENFFGGGAPLHTLLQVAEHYPVSLHGVGMGLASPDPLDAGHLRELRRLCDAVNPASISEHLCWNTVGGKAINDLLPFPYTRDALTHVAARVQQVQDTLGRRILIENLSYYLAFRSSEMREEEFLSELVARTGCGILFDVNNLFVNAVNLGVDADAFINGIPAEAVGEYHLAGPSLIDGCLVDTHSARVFEETWALYDKALHHIGKRPTLIEWDVDIPELSVLQDEARKAQTRMDALQQNDIPFVVHPQGVGRGCKGLNPQLHTHSLSNHERNTQLSKHALNPALRQAQGERSLSGDFAKSYIYDHLD